MGITAQRASRREAGVVGKSSVLIKSKQEKNVYIIPAGWLVTHLKQGLSCCPFKILFLLGGSLSQLTK